MKLDFIYKQIDIYDDVYDEMLWAFPLPEGLKEYRKPDYRASGGIYIDRNIEPITGIIYDNSGRDYTKITVKNGRPFCYDDLPSFYILRDKSIQSDPSIDYIDYIWKRNTTMANNNFHRLGGPAYIRATDQEVTYFNYYIFGYPMDRVYPDEEKGLLGYEIKHWFLDNDIDHKQMSVEDKEFFKMKWGHYLNV